MRRSPPTTPVRFRRSQRFALSPAGRVAEASYRSMIVASRVTAGLASYEAARTAWAVSLDLQPDDGVYLGEIRGKPITLAALVEGLIVCGKTRDSVLVALGRLVDNGMIAVVTGAAGAPA